MTKWELELRLRLLLQERGGDSGVFNIRVSEDTEHDDIDKVVTRTECDYGVNIFWKKAPRTQVKIKWRKQNVQVKDLVCGQSL